MKNENMINEQAVLCPVCGSPVHIYGPEDWTPSFIDPDSGGDPVNYVCGCGFSFSIGSYDYNETRRAFEEKLASKKEAEDSDIVKKLWAAADKLFGTQFWVLGALEVDNFGGWHSYKICPQKLQVREVSLCSRNRLVLNAGSLSFVSENGGEFICANGSVAGRPLKPIFKQEDLAAEAKAIKAEIEAKYQCVREVKISQECYPTSSRW